MSETGGNTPQLDSTEWQAAFAGSLDLCFGKYNKDFELTREYLLSSDPIKTEVAVMKKISGAKPDNSVMKFFRQHNLIDLLPSGEKLTIDVLWRYCGIAGTYLQLASRTGKLDADDITITVMTGQTADELFPDSDEITWENPEEGIYHLNNPAAPRMQIVMLSNLEDHAFRPMRLLSPNASGDDLRLFLTEAMDYHEPELRRDALAILNACASVNKSLFENIKEGDFMYKALREIMSEELAKEHQAGVNEGFAKGRALGKAEGTSTTQKALIAVIRDLKNGLTEGEILSKGYNANTLALAKSVV